MSGEHNTGYVLGPDEDGRLDVDRMFWLQKGGLSLGVYEDSGDTSSKEVDKKTKNDLADAALNSTQGFL